MSSSVARPGSFGYAAFAGTRAVEICDNIRLWLEDSGVALDVVAFDPADCGRRAADFLVVTVAVDTLMALALRGVGSEQSEHCRHKITLERPSLTRFDENVHEFAYRRVEQSVDSHRVHYVGFQSD